MNPLSLNSDSVINDVESAHVRIKVLNIYWEKIVYSEDEISKYTKAIDSGVYQIYGQHPAYGKDALLYVGKASRFADRLKERFEFIESCSVPTHIRLGRLVNSEADDALNIPDEKRSEYIDIAEKILIRSHTPAFNKQDCGGLFNGDMREFKGQNYLVLNWGDRGDLLPEVSTLRFSFRFWHFEKEF